MPEDAKNALRKVVAYLHSNDDVRFCTMDYIGVDTENDMADAMNPQNIHLMWQGGVIHKYNNYFGLTDNELSSIEQYFDKHGETYDYVHQMEEEFPGLIKKSDSRWLESEANPQRLGMGLCPL